jgi:hypothetical protein
MWYCIVPAACDYKQTLKNKAKKKKQSGPGTKINFLIPVNKA